MRTLIPREIMEALDRYIVGQNNAKRAVAIALRNRWRRQMVPEELRDEIAPKNIIMIGPTGVGKTEIAGGCETRKRAFSEDRGYQIHGSRLRGQGCGVDDPRSDGAFSEHGKKGGAGTRTGKGQGDG